MTTDPSPKLPLWVFVVSDVALLATAWIIAEYSRHPLSPAAVTAIAGCATLGTVVLLVPLLLRYERQKNEALDERQRALEGIARTVQESAEQLSIAANGLHQVSDLARQSLQAAEKLPFKLQEKIGAFEAQLANANQAERAQMEKELSALRAANTERIAALAAQVTLAGAEWSKLETASRLQLASANEALAQLDQQAATKISAAHAQALAELDRQLKALVERIAAVVVVPATAAATPPPPVTAEPTPPATAATVETPATAEVSSPVAVNASTEPIAIVPAAEAATATPPTAPKRPRKPRREPPTDGGTSASSATAASTPATATPATEISPAPVDVAPAAVVAEPTREVTPVTPPAATPEATPVPIAPAAATEVSAAPVAKSAAPVNEPAPVVATAPEPAPAEKPAEHASSPEAAPGPAEPAAVAASGPTESPRRRQARPKPEPAPEPMLDLVIDDSAPPVRAIERGLSSDGATRMIVTAYIGIGNRLFIRGEGPGLSPDKGVPLQFVSIGKWRWETNDATAPIRFRILKNDAVECAGLGEQTLEPGYQAEFGANF